MLQRRHIEFVKHTPARQILRRLYLIFRDRVQVKLNAQSKIEPVASLPKPLELVNLDFQSSRLEQTANGWVAHFLGKSQMLGPEIIWSTDQSRAEEQLWQMNLHYFEYLQHMPKSAGENLIKNWIASCRPNRPGARFAVWTPYTISLRLSAWLRFWAAQRSRFDSDWSGIFSASIREQAAYLAANLETDVRGNHLIKNIRALTEAGHSYSDDIAMRWREISDRHLARELDAQILPDGVHFEGSLSYHIQVFCDLLNIWAIRPSDALSDRLLTILEKMAIVIRDVQHPDGLPVQFNDSGLRMSVAPSDALDAFQQLFPAFTRIPSSNICFGAIGFFGKRDEGDFFVTKMGRIGPDSLMAHAHGDWGSFEWSHNGKRIFVDQGVFEYFEGELRKLSRSTKNHNTVVVNGVEQADFFGSFRCGSRPTPAKTKVQFGPEATTISSALTIKTNGHTHQVARTFTIEPNSIVITDVALSETKALSASLLLHPDVDAVVHDQTVQLTTDDGDLIEIDLVKGDSIVIEDAFWWPDMGVSLPSQRLVFTGHAQLVTAIKF